MAIVKTADGKDELYESEARGIAPIIEKMRIHPMYFKDACVADRVIGKASAMLLVAAGARSIYGQMMSSHAKKFLEKVMYEKSVGRNHARLYEFEAGKTVPYIINRDKTGMCPMEKAVLELENYNEAFDILDKTLKEMSS